MKKLLLAGLMAVTLSLTLPACGNKDYMSSVVPVSVLNQFHDMYPSARDVKWKMEDGLYEANFEVADKDMKATYTGNGDFVYSQL
jgi:hypothetical protein